MDEELKAILLENRILKQRIDLLEKWVEACCDHCTTITGFIQYNGFKRVGIYGYGKNGHMVHRMLSNTKIDFLCAIDKKANEITTSLPLFLPEKAPELDLVIVSPAAMNVDEIRELLGNKCKQIVTLLEILDCRNIITISIET